MYNQKGDVAEPLSKEHSDSNSTKLYPGEIFE